MLSEHLSILIVEDEESVARYFELSLVPVFDVVLSRSLVDAEKQISDRHFDCIVLDLTLPNGAGLETIRRLRHTCLPIVVVTGTETTTSDCIRAGASDVGRKPDVSPVWLQEAILKAIARARVDTVLKPAMCAMTNLKETLR